MQVRSVTFAASLGTAIVVSVGLFSTPVRADDAVDLTVASKQFLNSCGVCHTVEPIAEIRQGPNLATVFGRKAGTLAEFTTYSDALKKAGAGGLTWTEESLDKWITSATDFVPGAMMPYAQPDPDKRKLVIAYLKSLSAGGSAPAAKPATP